MICDVGPCVLSEQEKTEVAQKRDVEGMGAPEIKYGESMCFVQHVATGLWLTYASVDAKSARLGPVKRKVTRTHMDINMHSSHLKKNSPNIYSFSFLHIHTQFSALLELFVFDHILSFFISI